jgi:hypothetical protein
MGVENFQQIKQVDSFPLPVICFVLIRNNSSHPAIPLSKVSRSLCLLALHDDTGAAAVARRQRAADPSQQDVPVDEATAAARAVCNTAQPIIIILLPP